MRFIMTTLRQSFFLLLLVATTFATSAKAAGEDARTFVDTVGKQVLNVVNTNSGKEQKQQQLRQLFSDNVDITWMARFVLGSGWRQASEDQRTRYLAAYRQYLLTHYTSNFIDYAGSKYTITDAKSMGDEEYYVGMQVKSPNAEQQDTTAGYRVRSENGAYKIIDIIVENVSLLTTQRSEFSSVLQQKGMDGLISVLEAKTRSESKK